MPIDKNDINNTILTRNRRVRYEFNIIKSFEAGIVLNGTEVKSIRNRLSSIKEAYCYEYNGEIFIKNYHIPCHLNAMSHDTDRIKKLLLRKKEIKNIIGLLSKNRYALVPISAYSKQKYIKLEIGLAIGKNKRDKRREIKERDYQRSLKM